MMMHIDRANSHIRTQNALHQQYQHRKKKKNRKKASNKQKNMNERMQRRKRTTTAQSTQHTINGRTKSIMVVIDSGSSGDELIAIERTEYLRNRERTQRTKKKKIGKQSEFNQTKEKKKHTFLSSHKWMQIVWIWIERVRRKRWSRKSKKQQQQQWTTG